MLRLQRHKWRYERHREEKPMIFLTLVSIYYLKLDKKRVHGMSYHIACNPRGISLRNTWWVYVNIAKFMFYQLLSSSLRRASLEDSQLTFKHVQYKTYELSTLCEGFRAFVQKSIPAGRQRQWHGVRSTIHHIVIVLSPWKLVAVHREKGLKQDDHKYCCCATCIACSRENCCLSWFLIWNELSFFSGKLSNWSDPAWRRVRVGRLACE